VTATIMNVVNFVLVPSNPESNYIKISQNAKPEKFAEIGKKVNSGEVEFSYYTINGNTGYYYYRKL
jgi:hypothetical protein